MMRETAMYVTQSKYFSPAFNAAIFDGPIRIYFAQYQESQALKIYFHLQERFQEERKGGHGIFKDRARNIFVMLYPTDATFDLSFADSVPSDLSLASGAGAYTGRNIVRSRLGSDFVVGVRGPLEDEGLSDLYTEMDDIVKTIEV